MTYSTELKKGRKVEYEHKDTYKSMNKRHISEKRFYDSIAKDHLK